MLSFQRTEFASLTMSQWHLTSGIPHASWETWAAWLTATWMKQWPHMNGWMIFGPHPSCIRSTFVRVVWQTVKWSPYVSIVSDWTFCTQVYSFHKCKLCITIYPGCHRDEHIGCRFCGVGDYTSIKCPPSACLFPTNHGAETQFLQLLKMLWRLSHCHPFEPFGVI